MFGSKPNSAIRKRTSLLTPKPDVPTMTQFNFYGRKSELQTLSAFYANASTNLGVIYGRRRVGKSLLIKESLIDVVKKNRTERFCSIRLGNRGF